MRSQRQWQESRNAKKSIDRKSTTETVAVEENRKLKGCLRNANTSITRHPDFLSQGNADSRGGDHDARDDGDSGEASKDPNGRPADLSKKELEQLKRSKEKQAQERISPVKETTPAATTTMISYAEGFRRAFLSAQKEVEKARGVKSTIDIDSLMQYILPNHVWMGDFASGHQDSLNKIQRKMLVEYSRNN